MGLFPSIYGIKILTKYFFLSTPSFVLIGVFIIDSFFLLNIYMLKKIVSDRHSLSLTQIISLGFSQKYLQNKNCISTNPKRRISVNFELKRFSIGR
jgi:hypothetical protein